MRLVAIKLRQLGDTVLWTSALGALRSWKPNAEIHVVAPENYASLLTEDPRWTKVWTPSQLSELQGLSPIDTVCVFHASAHSRSLAQQIPTNQRVIHHHSRKPNRFGSDVPIPNLGKPASAQERDANVLRAMGWQDAPLPPPQIPLSAAMKSAAQSASKSRRFPEKRLAVLGPVASRPAKAWPLARYYRVARGLEAAGWEVIVITPPDSTLDPDLVERYVTPLSSIPTPNLDALAGVLSVADLYIGGDSGAKHLAASLGTQTLTLFGPESVGEWHGYDLKQHPVLRHPLKCRSRDPDPPEFAWCGATVCPLASHACMNLTTAEQVLETVEAFAER